MNIKNIIFLVLCAAQFSTGLAEETKTIEQNQDQTNISGSVKTEEHTNQANISKPNEFSEKEVAEFLDVKIDQAVDKIIEKTSKDSKEVANLTININKDVIKKAKKEIKEKLKKFKITGMATTWDANLALIYNSQNPTFTMSYKNSDGKIKTKKYESAIQSLGYKFQFDIKIDFIFFTNNDFSLYEGKKNIELGLGIDYKCPFINFTYSKFKTAPGGIVIIGLPIWWLLRAAGNTISTGNPFPPIKFTFERYMDHSGYNSQRLQTIEVPSSEIILHEFLQFSIVTGGSLKVID
ncbi:hypothetical protein K9L05_02220 [Candidatus Babeliales bacterium]|nr:hypothetical protein [Candidatus Babeliales bacterium]MCF7899445.1 hypothetical protein [Candidatus Babeliales bacterium]